MVLAEPVTYSPQVTFTHCNFSAILTSSTNYTFLCTTAGRCILRACTLSATNVAINTQQTNVSVPTTLQLSKRNGTELSSLPSMTRTWNQLTLLTSSSMILPSVWHINISSFCYCSISYCV
jgi:hypothetical protein